ncbi:MAG: intradiol ring-cleavage dioxygenase [Planctomycetota bacterium]
MKKRETNGLSIIDRRKVLRVLAAGSTLAVPGWALGKNSLWMPQEELAVTPQQTEGPFYPDPTIEQQLFSDNDLSQKLGNHEYARGQQCMINGVIRNRRGEPVEGSVVEIWQACASGRYNHSRDNDNRMLLDNNFQFWGRVVTGEDGAYSFKTIIPGKYPGRTARHIHYRVDADGYRRCSTQCYFSDFGEDNMRDDIYTSLNRQAREQVTIEFDKPAGAEAGGVEESNTGQDAREREESRLHNDDDPRGRRQIEQGDDQQRAEPVVWTGNFDVILANG